MRHRYAYERQVFARSPEPDAFEALDPGWEGETNRRSPAYLRWVQQSLNKALGLRLVVDGKMGPHTRSAIRQFQKRKGLTVDGIVGRRTEAALKATSASASRRTASAHRYVKRFSGSSAECTAALRRAGKTEAEALTIINTQIGVAIAMLRKAAADLRRGKRSAATRHLFLKIFRVRPEFVPAWLKTTATIKDRGDVVATRCSRVADLLASGRIRFFCVINATNCPDCGNDNSGFACSSWGDESAAPTRSNVICLGNAFWDDMKAGQTTSMLSTLMHEPFHIYYGKYVTSHRADAGKFGGINCIVQFVFEANGRTAPTRVSQRCRDMAVRRELDEIIEGSSVKIYRQGSNRGEAEAADYGAGTITTSPTPGRYYRIQYGKGGLLKTAARAYKPKSSADHLKWAQTINNHPLNRKFWKKPGNAYERKNFSKGIIDFKPVFACDKDQRVASRGEQRCFAKIWIPAKETPVVIGPGQCSELEFEQAVRPRIRLAEPKTDESTVMIDRCAAPLCNCLAPFERETVDWRSVRQQGIANCPLIAILAALGRSCPSRLRAMVTHVQTPYQSTLGQRLGSGPSIFHIHFRTKGKPVPVSPRLHFPRPRVVGGRPHLVEPEPKNLLFSWASDGGWASYIEKAYVVFRGENKYENLDFALTVGRVFLDVIGPFNQIDTAHVRAKPEVTLNCQTVNDMGAGIGVEGKFSNAFLRTFLARARTRPTVASTWEDPDSLIGNHTYLVLGLGSRDKVLPLRGNKPRGDFVHVMHFLSSRADRAKSRVIHMNDFWREFDGVYQSSRALCTEG
jgi:hypothetical protein